MCHSAQIWADYRRYVRNFGAELSIKEFYDLFWRRKADPKVKIPKSMEAAFAQPTTELERQIKALIDEFACDPRRGPARVALLTSRAPPASAAARATVRQRRPSWAKPEETRDDEEEERRASWSLHPKALQAAPAHHVLLDLLELLPGREVAMQFLGLDVRVALELRPVGVA